MSAAPENQLCTRRHPSSSSTSLSRAPPQSVAAVQAQTSPSPHLRSDSVPREDSMAQAAPGSRRSSKSPHSRMPSPEESTALYYRSCELFPRPGSRRPVSSGRSRPHVEAGTADRPVMSRAATSQQQNGVGQLGRHDSAIGYFDCDPYRNSAEEPRLPKSPTSPTSVQRPPTEWNFAGPSQRLAQQTSRTVDDDAKATSLLRFQSLSSPELSRHAHAREELPPPPPPLPPQTITYWSAPGRHPKVESQLWRVEHQGFKKAWHVLAPTWLLKMRRRATAFGKSDQFQVHYWDGEDDKCTVRRFKIR